MRQILRAGRALVCRAQRRDGDRVLYSLPTGLESTSLFLAHSPDGKTDWTKIVPKSLSVDRATFALERTSVVGIAYVREGGSCGGSGQLDCP